MQGHVLDFARQAAREEREREGLFGRLVISIGEDEALLKLRELVLRHNGYSVASLGVDQAASQSKSTEPNLWIFCSSVEFSNLLYLASNVRRYSPGSKLLLLEGTRGVGVEGTLFHGVLPATGGVDVMLKTIRELLLSMAAPAKEDSRHSIADGK